MNDDVYYLARTIEKDAVSFLHISDFQGVSEFLEKHSFEVYTYNDSNLKSILANFISKSFEFTDPLQRTHTINFSHLSQAVLEAKSAQDIFTIFVKLAGPLPWTIVFWLNVQAIDGLLIELIKLFMDEKYDIRFVISSSTDIIDNYRNELFETDEEYRNRLLQSNKVSWHFAEDLGTSSGEELDNIGYVLKIPRRRLFDANNRG